MFCRKLLGKLDHEYFCRLCYDKLIAETDKRIKKRIDVEDAEILKGIDEEGMLSEEIPQRLISLCPYSNEYRKAILRWKYKGVRKYAKGFAQLLVEIENVRSLEAQMIIPVPLAPSRMKIRGFNQALDLAREIGRLLDIPVVDLLTRCKDTKPQAKCTKGERKKNVYKSIIVSKPVLKEVNTLILIDDIYTTGSTIKECIRVLRKEFPFRNTFIYVVVIGRGELNP